MSDEKHPFEIPSGEYHPSTYLAVDWLRNRTVKQLHECRDKLKEQAESGNKSCIICYETMRRLLDSEEVGERYILGLVWMLRFGER